MHERDPSRRRVLLGAAAGLAGLAGCDGTSTPSDGDDGPGGPASSTPVPLSTLELSGEPVANGFAAPVAVDAEPGTGRLFVVDQVGQIYAGTGGDASPFLDVSDRTVDVRGYSERGLLGLAFHPDYAENGRFYVRYSAPVRDGTPDDYSHTFVLSEFTAEPGGAVDANSERTVLEIPEPQSNHNAGDVAFGPDGYLYVPVGDGGGAGDGGHGHVADWYGRVDGGNGQDTSENLLGSILRIDVEAREGDLAYGIPDDNPLVDDPNGRDEHYAWGFRNPWRISFGPGGRLFAGDVGQVRYEEVDVVVKGGNYGWNVREATHCYRADECPEETPDGTPLRPPVIEYPHDGAAVSGRAVIGGYLYDGSAVPTLTGRYVFADWKADGSLFVATEPEGDGLWPTTAVPMEGIRPNVLSFGLDTDGELLVCSSGENGGAVHRVTS